MSTRLQIISNHLSKVDPQKSRQYLKDPLTFLRLEDFIDKALNLKRKSLRQFLEREFQTSINDLYDKVDFPLTLLPKLKHMFGIRDGKYGCRKVSNIESYLNVYEASRIDASLGAFVGLTSTVIQAVYYLASEEQKNGLLADICNMKILVSWAYSEPETGSYSDSLQTTAEPLENGFLIKGRKKWVGNCNFTHILVWATNIKTKKIEAFLIPAGSKGASFEVTKGKFSARLTQTGILTLENVVVEENTRLSLSHDSKLVNKVFELSRTGLAMAPTGVLSGVFEHLIKYLNDKVRFGVPLTSYQMIQEKLVRILAVFNNSFLLAWRIIELSEKGEVTPGITSIVKSSVTSLGKDAVRLAREMMGSSGISLDNFMMKSLVDMESYYNLESTHNVSILVAGRELTGISAFTN